jgi:hypothetical protein
MIRAVHMNSCLAAQIRFMLFKGPGSFKKFFKFGGNVDKLTLSPTAPCAPPCPTALGLIGPRKKEKKTGFDDVS